QIADIACEIDVEEFDLQGLLGVEMAGTELLKESLQVRGDRLPVTGVTADVGVLVRVDERHGDRGAGPGGSEEYRRGRDQNARDAHGVLRTSHRCPRVSTYLNPTACRARRGRDVCTLGRMKSTRPCARPATGLR